ncbi:hypothetical protein TNIN_471741 [Trichonephila inaurata madagascariensis]|uniref:Uncharacterized protein n=1 Tax=Trichonephila inaurata madagascariensis TaxID=2747483 RepID=A0A8X6XTD8_9ARAC|nr:hypothetical protein TNIN_471741 [Trichonephila inaurata madagascariensis]
MPRTKRKNKSSKLSIQKRWCTETNTENNMEISEHNSNVAQHSRANSIFKNERVSMQEKSVLEQENVADTYDGPSYIIVDKNALCDIFKYTFCGSCNQSTLKLEFGHKYGFSHQLKLLGHLSDSKGHLLCQGIRAQKTALMYPLNRIIIFKKVT